MLTLPLGNGGYFLAVADGMGGIRGGEIASATALEAAREFLTRRFSAPVRTDQLKKMVRELYAAADDSIRTKQKENPHLAGMGTTLSCLLALKNKYVVGNIGDSRIYQLRHGHLSQITTDHTYVQEMIAKTGARPDPGIVKRFGHVVTRSIEGGREKPDLFPRDRKFFTLEDGDGFLLCSDGLIIDKSSDHSSFFETQFPDDGNLKEAAERMVMRALDGGSTDNVSVVLATWGRIPRTAKEKSAPGITVVR